MKRAAILLTLCALAANPVGTQPQPDPVGALPRPPLTAPVHIGETGRSPDGPPTAADLAYDNRLRASMAAARSFQGAMDGGWTLSAGGRDLYVFQLIERNGAVEGAWRDPRRAGALDASGIIDQVERTEAGLTFRIGERVVALRHDAGGRWTGDLTEAGRTEAVILRRQQP